MTKGRIVIPQQIPYTNHLYILNGSYIPYHRYPVIYNPYITNKQPFGALNFSWHSPWHAPSVDLVLECRRFTRKCMESCGGTADEDRTGLKKGGKNLLHVSKSLKTATHKQHYYDIQIMYRYTLTYTCMKINHSPFIGSCNSIKETFYWHPSHFLKIGTECSLKRFCPSAFLLKPTWPFPTTVSCGVITPEKLCGAAMAGEPAPRHRAVPRPTRRGKNLNTPKTAAKIHEDREQVLEVKCDIETSNEYGLDGQNQVKRIYPLQHYQWLKRICRNLRNRGAMLIAGWGM